MTTYSYDRENRLISQNVDGNVTSFAYDGFGRKRRESRGVNPDVILNWDGDQMIVESSDLDPEAPSKAYYVADGVIYAENANLGSEKSRRDYAVDYLGSVTGLTDSDASLSSVRRWSGYGKLLSGSSEPIGYFWTGNTGSRVYQSLGLNDNRARHYGRNIKQWITRDPLWPSELPYAYVGGNPVTRIDPSGMKAKVPKLPIFVGPGLDIGQCPGRKMLPCEEHLKDMAIDLVKGVKSCVKKHKDSESLLKCLNKLSKSEKTWANIATYAACIYAAELNELEGRDPCSSTVGVTSHREECCDMYWMKCTLIVCKDYPTTCVRTCLDKKTQCYLNAETGTPGAR
jgi:RHS repeat-associated protein